MFIFKRKERVFIPKKMSSEIVSKKLSKLIEFLKDCDGEFWIVADVVTNVTDFEIEIEIEIEIDDVILTFTINKKREDFDFLIFLMMMLVLIFFAIETRDFMMILMIWCDWLMFFNQK